MKKVKLGFNKDVLILEEDKTRKNNDGLIYQKCTWKNNKKARIKFKETFGFKYKFIESVWDIYIFDVKDLIFDIFARLGCAQCGKWRRSWCCPPAVPSISKCKKIIQQYDKCLMVVYRNDGRQNWRQDIKEGYHFCKKYNRGLKGVGFGLQHGIDREAYEMRDLFKKHGYKIKGFLSGKCSICWRSCTYENINPKTGKPEPCKFPKKAMGSPEAYGIDVYGLYEKFGIYYEHPIKTQMVFANMLIYKEK